MKEVLTAVELAERWDVEPSTIYTKIREGSIPTIEVLGKPRIPIKIVEEMESCSPKSGESFTERRMRHKYEEAQQEINQLKDTMNQIVIKALEQIRKGSE